MYGKHKSWKQVDLIMFSLLHVADPVKVGMMHDKINVESTSEDPCTNKLSIPKKTWRTQQSLFVDKQT